MVILHNKLTIMLLIWISTETNRTRYIFRLVIKDLLGIDFKVTTNIDEFKQFEGARLSYGKLAIEESIPHIQSADLLFLRGIDSLDFETSRFNEAPVIFKTYSKSSILPYDIFAASFFMVSRYEEYLPYRRDEHGRFSAKESLAWSKGFLQLPIVNIWSLQLLSILKNLYPNLPFKTPDYKFEPTIDVDSAFAIRHKGMLRSIGGYVKDISAGDLHNMIHRTKVISGSLPDPFDVFDELLTLHQSFNLRPFYFILYGAYGMYDKNIPTNSEKFKRLIRWLADTAEVGIHPSYASNRNPNILKQEVDELSSVLHTSVIRSRQHFLKLELPLTYRNLINLDIEHDYTMGFAAAPGFRAGITIPFKFYDLDLDASGTLTIHPFTLMDGTMKDYLKINDDEVVDYTTELIKTVRKYGGTFGLLWHNETFSETGRWKGWRDIYIRILKEAAV